jgi:hypothetical protein
MELLVGCRSKAELKKTEQFLNRFQIIPLTAQICDSAVLLLKRYRLSHGLLIGDSLIAASAISSGNPLITKNQRDFRFIQDLTLLGLVNLISHLSVIFNHPLLISGAAGGA